MCIRFITADSVISDIGPDCVDGKIRSVPAIRGSDVSNSVIAWVKGTRCSRRIFMRAAGMTPRIDDPKQGVSQTDVYQLMAYGRLYDCTNVMLLYPHHADLGPEPIRRRYSIGTKDAVETLIVATQDLAGPQRSQKDVLRELVLACLPPVGRPDVRSDSRKHHFPS